MRVACNFSADSYIYLEESERRVMRRVIGHLKDAPRGLFVQEFEERGETRGNIQKMLWVLVSLHIIYVVQKKRARVFRLRKDWEKRLRFRINNEEYWSKGKFKS